MSCALGKSPLKSVVLVAAFFSGDGLLRVLPGFLSDFLGPVACHYLMRLCCFAATLGWVYLLGPLVDGGTLGSLAVGNNQACCHLLA